MEITPNLTENLYHKFSELASKKYRRVKEVSADKKYGKQRKSD